MRKLTLIAAAVAAVTFLPSIASADYNGGGVVKNGKMCWQATSGLDHGMWVNCPKPAKAMKKSMKKSKKMKS